MHRNLGVDVMEKCLSQYPMAEAAQGRLCRRDDFSSAHKSTRATLQESALAADGDASWLEDQADQNRRWSEKGCASLDQSSWFSRQTRFQRFRLPTPCPGDLHYKCRASPPRRPRTTTPV